MLTNITGYSATKTRNAFNREKGGLNLEFHLKNVRINGQLCGCTGFIVNLDSDQIVYLDTESSTYGALKKKTMYRTAEHLKDYRGGRNQWTTDLADIIELLAN